MPRETVMKKNLIAFLFAAVLCMFNIVPALASGPVGGGTATFGSSAEDTPTMPSGGIIWDERESGDNWVKQNGGEVTVDDAISWVDRKGGQVVELCSHVLKPACIVGFIICVLLIVAGAVGNKRLLAGGLVGLFICGLCYACATSPVEILNAFSSFVRS